MTVPDPGIYEALVHPYRRRLLLAMLKADRQNAAYPDPLTFIGMRGGSPERRRIAMVHIHLPKLDDMGIIRWERETAELSKGPKWEELAPLLRWMEQHRDELPEGWLPGRSNGDEDGGADVRSES